MRYIYVLRIVALHCMSATALSSFRKHDAQPSTNKMVRVFVSRTAYNYRPPLTASDPVQQQENETLSD